MTTLSPAQAHSRLSNCSLVSVPSAHRPAFQGGECGTGGNGKDSASLSLSLCVGFFPPPLLSSKDPFPLVAPGLCLGPPVLTES